jgi:hypothetical protein
VGKGDDEEREDSGRLLWPAGRWYEGAALGSLSTRAMQFRQLDSCIGSEVAPTVRGRTRPRGGLRPPVGAPHRRG